MDTNKKNREYICALGDGELPEGELELAFAALQGDDGRLAWRSYQRIADVLREQAAPPFSATFEASLAARLAALPAHGGRGDGDGAAELPSRALPAIAP